MALKAVTDPNVLSQLDAPSAAPAGLRPVTDPALLAALDAPEEPVRAPGAAAAGIPVRGSGLELKPTDYGVSDVLQGVGELAASAVTGAAAKPISGVAGILSGGAALLSGRDPMEAGEGTSRSVQEALTYQPSEKGQQIVRPIAEAVAPTVKKAADTAISSLEAVGGPVARTAVPAALEAAADVLPAAAALRPAAAAFNVPGALKVAASAPSKSVAQAAVESIGAGAAKPSIPAAAAAARRANYKLRPSDVQAAAPEAKVPGKMAERFDNAQELKRDVILENQKNTTRLAGEEFGLKNTARFDEGTFDKLKAPHFKTYNEAERIAGSVEATPEFQQAFTTALERAKFKPTEKPGVTKVIGALRRRASKNIQAKDVATQEAGFIDREIADALEEQLGQRLAQAGDAKAIERYRAARQALAKVHDVETATRAGQVDAHALFKLQRKYGRLTGRLKTIAEAAENFPHATRHSLSTAASAIGEKPTVASMVKEGGAKLLRNVPGLRSSLDVRSPGFQERFGPVADEARRSYAGDYGIEPQFAPPRDPTALGEQVTLGLGEPLELATPGRVGTPRRAKPRVRLKQE